MPLDMPYGCLNDEYEPNNRASHLDLAISILNELGLRESDNPLEWATSRTWSTSNKYKAAAQSIQAMMASNRKLMDQVQDEKSSTRYLANLVTKLVEQSPTTVQVNHYKADMRAWCETLTVKWSMVKGDGGAVYFLFEDMKTAAMFKMMWIEAEDAK